MSNFKPQMVLSLNGGGVRGYMSLLVINNLWEYLKDEFKRQGYEKYFSEHFRPYELFTLIGGTSTGAIIAVMLGVLKMSIKECIDAYTKLSKHVFGASILKRAWGVVSKQSLYSSSQLRKVVETFLDDLPGPFGKDTPLCINAEPKSICKTVIVTVQRRDIYFETVLLRSWSKSDAGPANGTGWLLVDAILAATAAPAIFPPHKLGGYEYFDGVVSGLNNPAELLLEEGRRLMGLHQKEALFLDIGTGGHDDTIYRAGIPGVLQRLKRFITACEHSAIAAHEQCNRRAQQRTFFRLCVDQGVGNIRVQDYNKLPDMLEATQRYCEDDNLQRDYYDIARIVMDVRLGNHQPVFDGCNFGMNRTKGCLNDSGSWSILGVSRFLPDEFNKLIPYTVENHSEMVEKLKTAVISLSPRPNPTHPTISTFVRVADPKIRPMSFGDLIEQLERVFEVLWMAPDDEKTFPELMLISALICWAWEKEDPEKAKRLKTFFQMLLRIEDGRQDCEPTCQLLWRLETKAISGIARNKRVALR